MATIPFIPRLRNSINNKYIENQLQTETIEETIQKINQTPKAPQIPKATQIVPDVEANEIESNTTIDITNNTFEETDLQNIRIKDIHNNAEKFDPRTEETFKYLQIFTAMCDSFSHGANDVANAIGPFAAIYTIYQVGDVRKNSVMDDNAYWILAMGGVGIAIGLLVYGYKIIYAIGVKLCKITPSRGVSIELSSAIVIITGSRLNTIIYNTLSRGATVGVAALENTRTCEGINCKVFIKTMIGWVITCIIVGSSTAVLVLQGVHAPSINKKYNNITEF